MWILNFLICTILYLRILYLWSYRRLNECLCLILTGYFCCPVFKCGSFEVNGSYFITLILVVLCGNYFGKGKIGIKRDRFLLFQTGALCLMLMAGALNGRFDTDIIAPFMGHVNIAIGTFGCVLFFRRVNNSFQILRRAIIITNICHILFGVLQLTNASLAYQITSQLYATAGRSIPLNTMKELGKFARIFGATFSPTILGGYVLLTFSFVFALILLEKGKRKSNLVLLLSTLLLGFMAFSKTAIIGMPIIAVIFLVWILFHGGTAYRKILGKSVLLLLTAFGITVLSAYCFGLLGQVQYYFGTLLSNPLRAFRGRYGNSISMWGDSAATFGLAGTLALFRKHPVIGVGMVEVFEEFIGDSQYLSLLHNGGIMLFAATLLFYISVYMRQRKTKGLPQMMILTALMFAGLAMNVLTVANLVPFIAISIGIEGMGKQTDNDSCSDIRIKQYREKMRGFNCFGKRRQEI